MSKHWFEQFAGRFNFPSNYTCIDLETNGIQPARSAICVIGHTVVRDSKVVETKEVMLNWLDFKDIDQAEFLEALRQTETAMRRQNKPFHHTAERLRAEGRNPIEVLTEYLAMVEDMEERREVIVAHNGWRFDIEMLQAHFHNWLHIPFVFESDLVYDTGIAEKASQLGERDNPLPLPEETLRQFAWRIGCLRRRGVFWALDRYCDEQYGLFKQAGVDPEQAHSAGTDSLLLHYLVEEHRKLAGVADQVDMSTAETQRIKIE